MANWAISAHPLPVILGNTGIPVRLALLEYPADDSLEHEKIYTMATSGTGAFQVDTAGTSLTLRWCDRRERHAAEDRRWHAGLWGRAQNILYGWVTRTQHPKRWNTECRARLRSHWLQQDRSVFWRRHLAVQREQHDRLLEPLQHCCRPGLQDRYQRSERHAGNCPNEFGGDFCEGQRHRDADLERSEHI